MIIELTDLVVSEPVCASDFIAEQSGLSKSRVKLAMTKGAAWQKTGNKNHRLRRAKAKLVPGDIVSFYYSEKVLESVPPEPVLVEDGTAFTVWEKPAGLLSSGSRFGDHCSINRVVEQRLDRPTFLVHRLDQFVWGLMVLAHSKRAAAQLSRQFQERKTIKVYHAIVHGSLIEPRTVHSPLGNRDAITHLAPITSGNDRSLIEVDIETGRKHQIRQHLASIGHPIVGDLQYGSGATSGIQLAAVKLGFESPVDGKQRIYEIASNKRPTLKTQDAK